MDPLIIRKRQALDGLCAEFRVRRLELFGSAAKAERDGESNDLDFLIEFEEMEPSDYAEAYFGLLQGLTALFDKPVDLVVLSAVSNPYFLRSIEPTRTLLYAA
jgi:predicted nucleotidyltransferase